MCIGIVKKKKMKAHIWNKKNKFFHKFKIKFMIKYVFMF